MTRQWQNLGFSSFLKNHFRFLSFFEITVANFGTCLPQICQNDSNYKGSRFYHFYHVFFTFSHFGSYCQNLQKSAMLKDEKHLILGSTASGSVGLFAVRMWTNVQWSCSWTKSDHVGGCCKRNILFCNRMAYSCWWQCVILHVRAFWWILACFRPRFGFPFFQLSSPRPRDIRSGIKHSSAEAVSWFSLVLLALRCEFNLQSNTGRLYLPGREEKERRVYLM